MAYAGEYVYRFRVEDAFTPQLRRFEAAKNAHVTGMEEIQVTYGKTSEAQERLSQRLLRFQGAIVTASIVSFVFNLTQRRLAHAHERVRTAQERLNRAIERYGIGSEEARRAARRLSLAQRDLASAQWEANLQMVIAGIQLGMIALRLYEAAVKAGFFSATTAADIPVQSAHTAILWLKAKALTIITFGAAAAAGAIAMYAYMTAAATRETENLERAAQQAHRTIGEAPSWGLVKSLEDVNLMLREMERGIHIGGLTLIAGTEADLERALEAYNLHVRREWRRLRR